jgi:O-antigen/teichoic acid export membrane protein
MGADVGVERRWVAPRAPAGPRLWARGLDGTFLRRLAVAGLGNAVGRALGLLFAVLVAALFVPDDYGHIRWAMSVAMLAAIPAAAGPIALARALGAARAVPARQRVLVLVGLATVGAVTAACAVATALVLGALERPVGGVLAVLVGMTLYAACFNVYRGVGSAWRMATLYAGGNALQLGLVLLLCGALGWKLPDVVLVVYGFAWVLVLLLLERRAGEGKPFGIPLLHPAAAAAPTGGAARGSGPGGIGPGAGTLAVDRPASAVGALAELWRLSAPLALAQAAYTAWTWADVVLVAHYLGVAAAGYYGLVRTVVTVFLLVPEAVAMLLLPHVAAEGRHAGRLTGTLLGLVALVSLPLLGGVLLLGPPALSWFGGGRYAPATAALPGLAIGMAIYALYVVLEGHLVGLGRAGAHAAGVTVMAIATLGGAALLLPTQGLAGAGLAFALGTAAGLATLVLVGRGAPRQPAPAREVET